MNKQLEKILDSYRDEMTAKLQEFVRIDSVLDPETTADDAPYGKGIRAAYDYAVDLGKAKGFEHANYDYHAGDLKFGDGEESVGAVLHVDVVPPGEAWDYEPFGGELINGKIYGRGTTDNKGPLIAVLYACLAIKESGLPLSKSIKLIMGCNEEGGYFPCIRHYKEKAEMPGCGIVPDSVFPVAFAEKDFLNFAFHKRFDPCSEGDVILSEITGGEALNVVAPQAQAVFTDKDGNIINRCATRGKAAHASLPEQGINAISLLLTTLAEKEFAPKEVKEAIEALSTMLGHDSDGSGMDIDYTDHTGSLTNNVGLISYKDNVLDIKMNIRCPVTFEQKDLESKLKAAAESAGFEYEYISSIPHFYIDPDDPLVKLLIDIYQEETGDTESKPVAHGSGSYARLLDRFIPFGPSFQGEELTFHKENEHITTERLLQLSKIYAETLYRLAK